MDNEEELQQDLDEKGGGFEGALDFAKQKGSDAMHQGLDELRYVGKQNEVFNSNSPEPSFSIERTTEITPGAGAEGATGGTAGVGATEGTAAGAGAEAAGGAGAAEMSAGAVGEAGAAGAGATGTIGAGTVSAGAGAGAAGAGAAGAGAAGAGAVGAGAGAAGAGAGAAAAETGAAAASGAASGVGAIGSAISGLGGLIAGTMPASLIIIVSLVAVIAVYIFMQDRFGTAEKIRDAVMSRVEWFSESTKDMLGGLKDILADTLDFAKYEEEPSNLWNGVDDPENPEDVNRTMIVLKAFKEYQGQGDKETAHATDKTDPDNIDTAKESHWQELMSKENPYLSQENMIDVLQRCVDYNNEMFRYFTQHYEYLQWVLKIKRSSVNGMAVGKYWEKTYVDDDTKSDGLFELESRIHIEGEKRGNKRIFAVNWQDIMALALMFSENKFQEQRPDDAFVDSDSSFHKIEEMDPEAWMYDDEIQEVFDLFRYKFDYYYGTDADLQEHSTSFGHFDYDGSAPHNKSLARGDYKLGYRYKRIADPQPQDDLPLSYEYPGREPPYTKFVPEQAPNIISNSYDAYKYIYIDTGDVPDYTPDPDVYNPPSGVYCIGRWHILNPKHFVEAVDTMEPYWRDRVEDNTGVTENGKLRKKYENYEWSRELMGTFAEYLDVLPYTDEETQGDVSRGQFFRDLGEMYAKKTIKVSYEGTAYDGMDDFIAELEKQYKGWHVVWDKDNKAELKASLKEKLRKNGDTGEVNPVGGDEIEGGQEELTGEELDDVADEVMELAKIIYLESGNQPYAGKVAVATVIMNRVRSSLFSQSTIHDVIHAPHQFQPVGSGKFGRTPDGAVPSECINIAYNVIYNGLTMKGWPDDVIGFQNPKVVGDDTPERFNNWYLYAIIGGHYFYSYDDHGEGHDAETEEGEGGDYEKIISDDGRSGGTGPGIKTNMTGEFYPAFDDPNNYPFWSYGVTFHSLRGYGDNFMHISDEEFDKIADWPIEYEGIRVRDASEMIPDDINGGKILSGFLDYYWNQGTAPFHTMIRGSSGETYQQSGCLDCTVAMIASWWGGEHISPTVYNSYVDSTGQLNSSGALRLFGLQQTTNLYGNFSNGVKAEIDAGRPPIIHIRGKWSGSRGEYHTSDNGHFLTIYGYDDVGFYVADPGRSRNTYEVKVIPYEDWASVNDLYYRRVMKI